MVEPELPQRWPSLVFAVLSLIWLAKIFADIDRGPTRMILDVLLSAAWAGLAIHHYRRYRKAHAADGGDERSS